MMARDAQQFAVAIVDPVLDGPVANNHRDNANNYDGLQLLTTLAFNFPQTRLVVVSGSVGRESLRNAPEMPRNMPLVLKQNWDRAECWLTITRPCAREACGRAAPQIDQPSALN